MFTTLADHLAVGPAREARPAPPPGSVLTMDDAAHNLVRVLRGGIEVCTGFLVREPRCVVTDAYPGSYARAVDGTLELAWGDLRAHARQIAAGPDPFGPLVLEAPDSFTAPGLAVDEHSLREGEPVHVAVAVGSGTGMTTGRVTAVDVSLAIAPVGEVSGLVELAASTAPGASGGPVLDRELRVRGFIVAGSHGEEARSMAHPATVWAAALRR